LLLLSQFHVI
jgi:uncharacterized protein (DUF1330 family)